MKKMKRRRSERLLKGPDNADVKRSAAGVTVSDDSRPLRPVNNTMNIINRLSMKYLKNDKGPKKVNQNPQGMYRRSLRKMSAGSRGSLSTSCESYNLVNLQNSTSLDCEDLYDFNLSEDSLSLKLFPDVSNTDRNGGTNNSNKTNRTNATKKKGKNVNITGSKQRVTRNTSSTRNISRKNASNNQVKPAANSKVVKSGKKRPFWETYTNIKPRENARKKKRTSSKTESRKKNDREVPSKQKSAKPLTITHKDDEEFTHTGQNSLDNDVFTSASLILSPVMPTSTSTPANDYHTHKPTSTPSILLGPAAEIELYEEPAYESFLHMDCPELSPVKKVTPGRSPSKHASSFQSPIKIKIPLTEKTYGNISFSDLTEREKSVKKKKLKQRNKKRKGKYDKLAEQINKQFEELDSYELSVDS